MRGHMNSLTLFLLVCLTCLVSTGNAVSQEPQAPPATTVLVEKSEVRELNLVRKYTGAIEAINEVPAVARVSGKIMEVCFEEGSEKEVQAGDPLFKIEDTVYVANVESARANVESCIANIASAEANIQVCEAQLKQAQAQCTNAKRTFDREKKLFDDGRAVSEQDFQAAECALLSAQAAVQAAEAQLGVTQSALSAAKAAKLAADAQLTLAEENLSYTDVRAEITGRVGRLPYARGTYVTPASQPLITVVQYDPIYIKMIMSEKDFVSLFGNTENLKETTTVSIQLSDGSIYSDAEGKPVLGKIAVVDNKVKSAVDSITIWVEFPNAEYKLNPGGIVRVNLTKLYTPGVSVKHSAIQHTQMGSAVYVVNADGTWEPRPVGLGVSNETFQAITSGLKAGEVVVTGGANKVRPGARLKPVYESELVKPGQPAAGAAPAAGAKSAAAPTKQAKGTQK